MFNKAYIKKFIQDSWIALRPLSLTLAVGSTTLGILAAYQMGAINVKKPFDLFLIFLITVAGLLAQSGANLVNDYFEGSFRYYRPGGRKIKFLGVVRTYFDVYVFLWAMACFATAGLIGLFLIYITDLRMLFIGLTGLFIAYAYTGEPFVLKRKGLGVIISFIAMGPLMVLGASFPFTKELSWSPILLALPASLFIPALMISNEMRDFTRDQRLSIGTLSVRIGSKNSTYLYRTLVFGAYVLTLIYVITGLYHPIALIVFFTLKDAMTANQSVTNFEKLGIPYTNRLHWKFTLLLIISLLF